MIKTYSKFYYGHVVDSSNQTIDFKEGSEERKAVLRIGSYTLAGFAVELQYALNAAGEESYVVTLNRSTRKITIASDQEFSLLAKTGTSIGVTSFRLAGFSDEDRVGSTSYQGDLPSGKEYIPPFMLQDYLDSADNREAVDSVESESAGGRVQGVSFGERSFTEFNIKWVRAENFSDGWITTTVESVKELREFLDYARKKHPIEFMKDRADPSKFESIRLDSTEGFRDGSGFRLKEMHAQGLPGFFETGILRFRVL